MYRMLLETGKLKITLEIWAEINSMDNTINVLKCEFKTKSNWIV